MARIEDKAKKGRADGGYGRLFGDPQLGRLLSQVHSTVISAGNELEQMIVDRVAHVPDLDAFLEQEIMPEGVLLARKRQIKSCQKFKGSGTEPDFMIFRRRQDRQHCHLVELKDGDAFDTKKAQGERDALHSFRARIAPDIPYTVSVHFCSFNQDDRAKIVAGFKGKIEAGEALTGREFCELLEIDYEEIVNTRLGDQPVNLRHFVGRLKEIEAVRREWER